MTDPIQPGEMNHSQASPISVDNLKRYQSRAGYWFAEEAPIWQLDKGTSVNLATIRRVLGKDIENGFTRTLSHYARNMSAGYVKCIYKYFYWMMRVTGATDINPAMLINFRATLTRDNEHRLSVVRTFLFKWHYLGYAGLSHEVIDLLGCWTFKNAIMGDAVKRLDPNNGPLTDNELLAFNEGAVRAFEQNLISVTDLSMVLLISYSGRRPQQIAYTKIRDLDGTLKNMKGEMMYCIHIPRAKQQGGTFRDDFKVFALTWELWVVLQGQRKECIESVERVLGYELQEPDRLDLPLFPDLRAFDGITSVTQLRSLLQTDRLHPRSDKITRRLQRVASVAKCKSERTGELLNAKARRFRYTKGTRAAREGWGILIIAEMLDHTDTQSAGIYIKNVPEHVAALDKAVGHQMVSYAQAFQGALVDREGDARRGHDPSSRIRHKGKGTGTCGTYGFCGANVPIPCYTCMHFQPWLDARHEIVHADLLAQRKRILDITGDVTVASVNDRSIDAVAEVIWKCRVRSEELQRKGAEK